MPPRHLDPRVKYVWIAPELIVLVVVWLVASAAYVLLSVDVPLLQGVPKLFVPPLLLIIIAVFAGVPAFLWHHITYVNFTYELAEHEIIIREGVLTRKRTVIPYGRVQNITTERTLFERMLGLATIKIETAGANQNVSEGIIPGIGNRDQIVQELLGNVERLKKDSGLETLKEEKPAAPAGQGGGADDAAKKPASPDQPAVLMEILEELKEIKLLLKTEKEERADFSDMRAQEDGGRGAPRAVEDEPEFKREISKILRARKKPK